MDFQKCLTEPMKKLCTITNEELSFAVSGEIEIEPGRLIRIRFLSDTQVLHERFEKVRIDSMGGSGILVDLSKNGETISALYEYEYVASYGYFSGSSEVHLLDDHQIARAQIHCSRLHDLRLPPDAEVQITTPNGHFTIVPYRIDRSDYAVTSSEWRYYIEEASTTPLPIETVLGDLDSIRMYASLVIDNPVNIDQIVALIDSPGTEERRAQVFRYYFYFPFVHYNTYERRNELNNRRHIAALTTDFAERFQKWNLIYSQLEQPIRVFYNSLYSSLIIDHKMLNLATFLETYHKKVFGKKRMEYKARLIVLIQDNTSILSLEPTQVERLAELIKKQRNIVAHTDAEYRLDQDLYKLVNTLLVLIQAILLKKVLDNSRMVEEIMESRKDNYFLYDIL